MGLVLTSRMYFSFTFPLFNEYGSCLFFPVRRIMGRRRPGIPHYDCASWSGVRKGCFEKPVAVLKGAEAQALSWPFRPHVAGYK